MNEIAFSKMTGLGNDFIFINNVDGKYNNIINNIIKNIPKLCKRAISIGADGLVIIEKSKLADFSWKFYNSDGSIAEMCGNAARCAAKYAYLNGIADKKMSFETIAGIINAEIINELLVKAELTKPWGLEVDKNIIVDEIEYNISIINTGVPHVVVFVDNVDDVNVQILGSKIRNHKKFTPKGTNVNFCKVLNEHSIIIRTYERGVEGETLACGTGALASAIISNERNMTTYPIEVTTRSGGIIKIIYEGSSYYIEAEARLVYRGFFYKEAYMY